ncbi:WD40/YVTN/BNR-like repeat-containing protein [Mucilaginibacter jinjuensis]|uniref:YCF48-related protein n=1 Tax=Mucilaginibacter jinjuensis TaxID=1176721 RepID=A0ABY7TBZ0_9SPHI|nr:YCF48-related protein [Mucilaginibacter jinjuensis]WCT13152.1 YCF48-related protein [Mucilaginibacter jinjuensis]
MNPALKYAAILITVILTANTSSAQGIKILEQTQSTSVRGLSVVNDKVAWVSGSKGYIGLTVDGGTTWQWQQVKGFEQSDFRDIEAFSDQKAVIMSSGIPALIMTTANGGKSWQVNYRNDDKAYFLDAMAFADDKHGYTLGDPINGKFVLLETKDGGHNWKSMANAPAALPNEACFAASGTCIAADKNTLQIVTGGSVSRLLSWDNKDWVYQALPILHGKESQGAFSFAGESSTMVFVGGDYQDNHRADSVAYVANFCCDVTKAGFPQRSPAGFQSCVNWLGGSNFISTGTSGTNLSTDGGNTWARINDESFNVCQQAKHGKLVLLAGDKGKIALYEPYLPHN